MIHLCKNQGDDTVGKGENMGGPEKQKRRMPDILCLLLCMLKIGAFTFGGGYAMIALLQNEFVARRGWMEKEEFLDMVAVAESTPGPVAVNAATYLGYRRAGVLGAALSTIAVCTPAFLVIYVISLFFDRFLSFTYVACAFRGIRVCVVYLIAAAGLRMLRDMEKTPLSLSLFVLSFAAMVSLSLFAVDFSSVWLILVAGAVGLSVFFTARLARRRKGGGGQ